jgi:hypothetical protein
VEVVKPVRKLLKEKEKLQAKRPRPSVQARLAQIDEQVKTLTRKVTPKTPRPLQSARSSAKRPYKNLALVLE